MPAAQETKKWGGARKGSGNKKGAVYNKVIKRREEQGVTLRDIETQIQKRAGKIIDSQYVAALGTYQICVLARGANGKVEYQRVTNEKEMCRLLDEGKLGEDYMVFTATDPDWKAGDALLNRGFGKPKESVVHSGGIGILHLIKSLNTSDGNDGATEE